MPAPSQKRLTVMTFEHLVLPFTRSYMADGDIPPLRQASQILIPFCLHISFILFTIASFSIMAASPITEFLYGIPQLLYARNIFSSRGVPR